VSLKERQTAVQLTAREREVLAWVARGKTNAEVARQLWLAPSTVRKHLENVYAKLGGQHADGGGGAVSRADRRRSLLGAQGSPEWGVESIRHSSYL
jgi:DNA-binding CsgD family transcriptional regulator